MKKTLRDLMLHGAFMLVLLGASYLVSSWLRQRHPTLFHWVDSVLLIWMVLLVLHAFWLIFKKGQAFGPKRVSNTRKTKIGISAFLFVLGLLALIMELKDLSIRDEGLTQEAVQAASMSSTVQSALGTDIKVGWPIRGNFNFSGMSGNVDVVLPTTGARSSGDLHVMGVKRSGQWTVSSMLFRPAVKISKA